MIVAWPWGNYWEESKIGPSDPTYPDVYPTECEDDEPALLGPKGEPLRWVRRHPIGFSLPEKP